MEQPTVHKKKSMFKNWMFITVLVLFVALAGAVLYFWNDARVAKQNTADAVDQRNQEETAQVITELSEILLIKTDDEPTVARVEDPEVLRNSNEEFYADAEAGDYIILYPRRAIIYRSSNQQIINVAPIINTSQLTPPAPSADTTTESTQPESTDGSDTSQ